MISLGDYQKHTAYHALEAYGRRLVVGCDISKDSISELYVIFLGPKTKVRKFPWFALDTSNEDRENRLERVVGSR